MQQLNRVVFTVLFVLMSSAHAETFWIDVRSAEENKRDNIQGDLNIPHLVAVSEIEKIADKDDEIHLYCRSGGRAGLVKGALDERGYSNVSNEGGINQARVKRGLPLPPAPPEETAKPPEPPPHHQP